VPQWLASIVGFEHFLVAHEVPFMRSPTTGQAAGRIDIVVSNDLAASQWLGLEIQAVYFSGEGMQKDFELLHEDEGEHPAGAQSSPSRSTGLSSAPLGEPVTRPHKISMMVM